MRSKVCVADWNGDGRPDLLLGDFAMQKPELPEPTAEEKAQHDKIRAELATLRKEYSKLINQVFGKERPKDEAAQKAVSENLQTLREKMQGLQEKLPVEAEDHGWVWLFLRRAP
jgi:hypothetical protein